MTNNNNNQIKWLHNRVCLNVLANSIENAVDVVDLTHGHVIIGMLAKNYPAISSALVEMRAWQAKLNNKISIGLGDGDGAQAFKVAKLTKQINPQHANQVFTGVGLTVNDTTIVNCLVSPSKIPGLVKINTGNLSKTCPDVLVPITTAIMMIKDMGGNSVKFYPMRGLATKLEYLEVVKACAKHEMILEPTGGIDLTNYQEILTIALANGVSKIIPHIYNAIIDPVTKATDLNALAEIYQITEQVCTKFNN